MAPILIDAELLNYLEAALLSGEHAISTAVLQKIIQQYDKNDATTAKVPIIPAMMPARQVQTMVNAYMQALNARYAATALQVIETALGWQVQVRLQYAHVLQQVWPERTLKLSNALLEILAIIAYKQPVTRGDIEQIRGVTVNSQVLRQLFERQWIEERGHRDIAGRPALLYTTPIFLDAFGLKSLADLPPMPKATSSPPA